MVGKYVSQHYQDFVDLCGKAYVSVRRHSGLLIALFELMVSGHMRVHTSSTVSTELAMSKLPGLLSFRLARSEAVFLNYSALMTSDGFEIGSSGCPAVAMNLFGSYNVGMAVIGIGMQIVSSRGTSWV